MRVVMVELADCLCCGGGGGRLLPNIGWVPVSVLGMGLTAMGLTTCAPICRYWQIVVCRFVVLIQSHKQCIL